MLLPCSPGRRPTRRRVLGVFPFKIFWYQYSGGISLCRLRACTQHTRLLFQERTSIIRRSSGIPLPMHGAEAPAYDLVYWSTGFLAYSICITPTNPAASFFSFASLATVLSQPGAQLRNIFGYRFGNLSKSRRVPRIHRSRRGVSHRGEHRDNVCCLLTDSTCR